MDAVTSPVPRESGPRRGSEFSELSDIVKRAGLMDRRPVYFAVKGALTLLAFAGAWVLFALLGDTWWQLFTVVAPGHLASALAIELLGRADNARDSTRTAGPRTSPLIAPPWCDQRRAVTARVGWRARPGGRARHRLGRVRRGAGVRLPPGVLATGIAAGFVSGLATTVVMALKHRVVGAGTVVLPADVAWLVWRTKPRRSRTTSPW